MTEKDRELLHTSRKFFKEGHYRLVEPLLKELLKENKFNPEIYYMTGFLLLEKGQLKKAMASFKKALEIDPHFTNASIGLSVILNDLGRYEEGREVFEKAYTLRKQKKSPSTVWNASSNLQKNFLKDENTNPSDSRQSGTNNQSFKTRNNSLPSAHSKNLAQKHGELGDLYFNSKNYQTALEHYNRAWKLSKNTLKYQLKIIDCLIKMNLLAQALKTAQNLQNQYRHNGNLVSKIIWIRRQMEFI